MNLDELYFMIDEKDECENPFITPELTRAYHAMEHELSALFHKNTAPQEAELEELLDQVRSSLLKVIDMEKQNAFRVGYKTALELLLIK
ncbi:MAG: hypothetical protein ACLSVG_00160 [Clostridia bacterium]